MPLKSNFRFMLLVVPQKIITRDKLVEFINDEGTKRINFASSHSNALKRGKDGKGGKIVLPFKDTIEPILKNRYGKDLFNSQYGGVWLGLNSEVEFENFEKFVQEYKEIVFLRDNLDLSLALSMNFDGDERTPIGEFEYQAKFNHFEKAEKELIKVCNEWIEKLPFLKKSEYICAMPSSDPEERSLPRRIVSSLEGFKFADISDSVIWTSKTRSSKNAESPLEKLKIMEESGLQISNEIDLKGKTVLLFDDLYMSGISMQYVAMKLKDKGASRVFGLCIVKSRSNTAR